MTPVRSDSGRSFTPMVSPSVMISSRSTTFRSSLTLPFQKYFSMAAMASEENFFGRKLFSSAKLRPKYSIS
ncbi:MAG: hypothetical protein WAU81_05870 [Candidatus Aminicenantales bacterium]